MLGRLKKKAADLKGGGGGKDEAAAPASAPVEEGNGVDQAKAGGAGWKAKAAAAATATGAAAAKAGHYSARKASAAKDSVLSGDALKKAKSATKSLTDKLSPDAKSFLTAPSLEKLQQNPQYLFNMMAVMQAYKHPGAALFQATVAGATHQAGGKQGIMAKGMAAAEKNPTVAGKMHGAKKAALGAAVGQATGGAIKGDSVPPAVMDAVVKNVSPSDMKKMFDMYSQFNKAM